MTSLPEDLAMIEHRQSREARANGSQADTGASAVGSVFDSTRELAALALERAAEKMRDLREGVADTASGVQRKVHDYAGATSRYVADQPVRAALIAVGIGALITAAILVSRRRHNRY
jgi:ElaB/YqjD/DUF883 family membrane-anchored ribosome-binding protein